MIYFVGGGERLFTGETFVERKLSDLQEWLKSKDSIAVDTETEGLFNFKKEILTLQIGDAADQWVIDVQSVKVKDILKGVFEDPSVQKLFWNAKFDISFLKHFYGWEIQNVYDGFLVECILTTGHQDRELSLGDNALKYCNYRLDKSIRGNILRLGLTDSVIKYAAEDVAYLHEIQEKQMKLVESYGLTNVVELENEFVLSVVDIELNGMRISVSKWRQVAEEISQEVTKQLRILDKALIDDERLQKFVPPYIQGNLFEFEERLLHVSWTSPKQTLKVLHELGIPCETTSEKEIVKYQKKYRLVKELIRYKKLKKLESSFGLDFLKNVNPVTNRVHQDIWQILETGRISSSKPNLTQIPSKGDLGKKIRECFISEDGWSIVGGDYSGCEIRILTEGSQDPVWLEEFKGEGKVHDKVACMMFGIEMSQTKETPSFLNGASYRDVAKTVDFGLSYGMSEYKLADTLQVSIEEAKALIGKFFKAFPSIKEFLDRLGNFATVNGYTRTYNPYRRIRWFPQWKEAVERGNEKVLGEIDRAGRNTPIQGTNADIVKLAVCMLTREIIQSKYRDKVKLINIVHDEVLAEVRDDFTETWKHIMDGIMIKAGEVFVKSIPMSVDCNTTKYWTK